MFSTVMAQTNSSVTSVARRGAADYNWEVGSLTFMRNFKNPSNGLDSSSNSEFLPFGGFGVSLKDGKVYKEMDSQP